MLQTGETRGFLEPERELRTFLRVLLQSAEQHTQRAAAKLLALELNTFTMTELEGFLAKSLLSLHELHSV